MDFKDQIKQLSDRVSKLKNQILTEEATKNAFIMPFIQILGFDVFDPTEVVPELDCDLIRKKGEKIDYAIMKDGEPAILIECKHWQQNLDLHSTQLQKYFVASKAKFGLLTNGIIYRFYTDLVKQNIMDDVPFLELNLEDLKDATIEEVKKFHKSYFDVDNIMGSANELKYMSELRAQIRAEFTSPSADFVRLLTKRVFDGTVTQKVIDQFTDLVHRSLSIYINDVISDRLNIAIQQSEPTPSPAPDPATVPSVSPEAESSDDQSSDRSSKIVTTEEELNGFYIVKSIVRDSIPAERVTSRDSVTYFAIFADDNNRRPICRLYFNSETNKQVWVFVPGTKDFSKHKITSLDDMFSFADELKAAASYYA